MSMMYLSQTTSSDKTGDGTPYLVMLDQFMSNWGDAYDSTTGTYTVPRTGTYNISWNCRLSNAPAAGTFWGIYIDISNVGKFYGPVLEGGLSEVAASMSISLPLYQTQTLKFYTYMYGGSKTASVAGNNASTNIPTFASIYLIPSGDYVL